MSFPIKGLLQSLASLLFLALVSINPALAFQLNPASQQFAPAGQESTRSYTVTNDGNKRIAVEITVVERHMSLSGEETYESADEDFLVYPSQMILEPGAEQTVRVTWLGDPAPNQELAYRLIAEQLPVNLVDPSEMPDHPVGEVELLSRYVGAIYIHPEGTASNVEVDTVEAVTGEGGETQLAITLNNLGTARARLKNLKLHLTAQGTTVDLEEDQLQGMENEVILAGNRRRFVLPWPASLPQGPVTATFEYGRN